MNFSDYQRLASTTAVYPDRDTVRGLEYTVLGLTGEAGSVANQVKKVFRDDAGRLTPERRRAILRQAGDTLWYLSQLCEELGYKLEALAEENIDKLQARKANGTLHGDGDSR